MQHAVIVSNYTERCEGSVDVNELNKLLADGWRVVSQHAMGAASLTKSGGLQPAAFASLVILERPDDIPA